MNRIEIDVYSDFVCPWCFIGLRRLQEVLQSFGDLDVVTHHRPYLLYPDVPVGGIDLRASLAQRYQKSPERLFEPVEAAGREVGIPFDFSKVTRVYSTVDAHTLVRHAERKGTSLALAERMFAAHFLEGRNIADRSTLVDLAVRHGCTEAEAHALLEDAHERLRTRDEAERTAKSGVRAVPFYIMDGRVTVSGAQRPSVFRDAIERALSPVA
jgi:predicted DsbA family dithiol-disulfide isomerase